MTVVVEVWLGTRNATRGPGRKIVVTPAREPAPAPPVKEPEPVKVPA